ncbi:phage tail sheath subtilisin-like domain-containing protein [Acetobacter cibinongensis]|uniref:Tail sheath protein n=1 Tax=Acetobacter cibinongensis TaxID=146475 RepID=A0A1Z5YW51_9PROT|nr:phage tail sheath subtilisin-like domain-containing protein [Acetobacter cibinongensis]OUJ03198.1 tail sheath protein [Acetobacter cibinongensis]
MSSAISIPGYSDTNRVPGFYLALDNSVANSATANRRILLVGQMLSGGAATAGVAEISSGPTDALSRYGAGSQCARMVAAYRKLDSAGEVWVLPLADAMGANKATGTITVTGPATASGVLSLYVSDTLISVPVEAGDSASTVATNAVSAARGAVNMPVALSASNGVLTATALNAGLAGNDILLAVNMLGIAGGQVLPAGLSVTVTAMSGGALNPDVSSPLSGLGERIYDLYSHPYTDTGSLTAFRQKFDNLSGNWSPMRQLYGHHITAIRGSYGTVTAFGLSQNDPHGTVMPIADSPSCPLVWAAQLAAVAAVSMRDNPALPIKGLSLTVLPPSDAGRFTFDERNSLLYDGLSTFTVDDSGTVLTERLITTYQKNASGVPDDSYLDLERLLTAQIAMQDMRTYLASRFSRFILVADGTRIPAGARATTAQLVGKAAAARYRWQATQFWVQNPDTFAANIVAQNSGNGAVKLLMPFQFAEQLWIIAGNVQFLAA